MDTVIAGSPESVDVYGFSTAVCDKPFRKYAAVACDLPVSSGTVETTTRPLGLSSRNSSASVVRRTTCVSCCAKSFLACNRRPGVELPLSRM